MTGTDERADAAERTVASATTSLADSAHMAERAELQRQIVNRLRRAHGQLGALITAVEAGGSCRDVLTQLAALSSAIDRAGFKIVSAAMRDCLANPDADSPVSLTVEEIEKLFLMLA